MWDLIKIWQLIQGTSLQDEHELPLSEGQGSGQTKKYNIGQLKQYVLTFVMDRISLITKGDKGDRGDTGAKGEKGDKGAAGDRGSNGVQGIKGDQGIAGPVGIQGAKGDKGEQGNQGPEGVQGIQGIQGESGESGQPGQNGQPGEPGEPGIQGAQGEKGDVGPQGIQGVAGTGIPVGGTAGQFLEKANATNYNVQWTDFGTKVLAIPSTGLSTVTGTPTAADSVITILSKFKSFFDGIAATIRVTVLTGLTTGTNSAVTATDSLLIGVGKLQAQVNAKQAVLSIPTDAEMQVGTDNVKYVTPLRNAAWWTWTKTQAQTVAGIWSFISVKLTPGTAPSSPVAGQLWYETLGDLLKFRKGSQNVEVVTNLGNTAYTGIDNRLAQFNNAGDIIAVHVLEDGDTLDSDIITALTSAAFNTANRFTVTITPANAKIFHQGMEYYDSATIYNYRAIGENIVRRFSAS